MEVEGVYVKIGIKNEFSKQLPAITSGLNNVQKQFTAVGSSIQKSFGSSLSKSFSSLGSSALKGLSSSFSGIGKVISSSFGSAKTAINNFANSAKNSFKGIQSSLGKSFGSVNLSSLKSSLAGVQKSVSNVFSGIKNSVKSVSFSGIGTKIKSSLNSAFTSIKNTATSLGTTLKSKLTGAFSGAGEKIKSSLSTVKTSLQSVASAAQSGFNKIVSAGKSVEQQMGLIGTAITAVFTKKLTSAIESATSVFMNFDDQMRKVQAVTESTGDQFEALTTQAKLLGATTSFTAQDAAEAMTYLGQAGFNSTQIIAAMPATLNLARASMTELGTTADIMSNIMNGFQIGAEDTARASDVLSKAANATNTDVTGLGQAMKYAAPLANQMGWSLEETAAAAGNLSNAGIKADMAGTVLRNAITRLIAPTDKVVGILSSYGISLDMVNPKTHSLADILDVLTNSGVTSGNMMQIFGMRAGPGMMALVNQGTASLRTMNQTLLDSAGYAQKAADEMDAGWGGVVRLLGDTVEALQLSFGGALANILTPFAKAISVVGYAISQLHPVIITMGAAFALASVAAGTLLVALAALPTITGVLSAGMALASGATLSFSIAAYEATGATVLLEAALAVLTAPLSAIVVAAAEVVTAVALIGISLYELEQKTQIFSKTWETLKDLWTIGTYYIGQAFDRFKTVVGNAIDSIQEKLHELVEDTWLGSFIDSVTGAYDKISSFLGDTRSSIHDTAESIREEEAKQAESAKNVQSQIEAAHSGIVTSYQTVDEATGETYASMIENADSGAEGVSSATSDIISSNNELISSNEAVSASSPTIKYALDQTDIDSISDPTKGDAFVTVDALNKGIELADGSMLKFNQSGEIVIETLDGIQKRLYDIGNTSLDTADSKKIWTITDNYTESNGKLVNNTPTKHVSLSEATAAAEEEDAYQKSPEATAADWAEAHPSDTMLYVKSQAGNGQPAPKTADKYSSAQVQDMLYNKKTNDVIESNTITVGDESGQASIERGKNYENKNNPLVGQGKTPLSEKYLKASKKQDMLKALGGGTAGDSTGLFGAPSVDLLPTWKSIWSMINKPIDKNVRSASFAPNLDGVVEKYNIVKEKMQEINSFSFDGIKSSISGMSNIFDGISFDGLKSSIQGYVDKFKDSAAQMPGVQSALGTLNSISYEGLKSSVQGYISKFSESVSQIPGVQTVLSSLNGISYEGLKTTIQGYMSKFGESVSQNPIVKSTLESLNSISYEGLKTSITGYISKFGESITQNPTVKSTLESLNSISYEGLKTTIQGYMSKFGESVSQNPIVKSTLESLNSISYEGLKTTIQGYMTKFADSAAQIPIVKSVLEGLNSISYDGLKTTIQGVITKFGDTVSTIPGVKLAIEGINNISFSGLLSSIGTVSKALEGLITSAKTMYGKVKDYVSNATNEKSKLSNSTNGSNSTTNNTTNNNNVTIKTYASASNTTQWVKRVTGG